MARERTAWFAMIDGREAGPMSRAEFALRLATDVVDEETFVWKEGMREWLPAAQVGDLAPMFHTRKQAKQSGVRPPPPPPAAKGKAKRPEEDAGGGVSEDADEEEIVLELDLDAMKPHKPAPAAGLPFTAPAARPPVQTARPPVETARPPVQTARPPVETARFLAPAAPRPAPRQSVSDEGDDEEAARPAPAPRRAEPTPPPNSEEEKDWSERTVMEVLPLGERVHQEEVAGDLFAPTDTPPPGGGKTGSFALDSLKWAYAKKTRKETKAETTNAAALLKAMQATAARPAAPIEPVVQLAAPPRQPLPPVNPAALAGARPPMPRRPSPKVQTAIVWGVVGVGGLIVGLAIFLLLRLLL
jgi:hypothetical protein